MERIVKKIEEPYLKSDIPVLEPGDTVKVIVKVVEGDKSRLQIFEGVIISIQGEGMGKTIKVRKISYGVGVERTFPLHSPIIEGFEVIKKGSPRRAKLFYLRGRVGKRALKVKTSKKKTKYGELLNLKELREETGEKPSVSSNATPQVLENTETPSSEQVKQLNESKETIK